MNTPILNEDEDEDEGGELNNTIEGEFNCTICLTDKIDSEKCILNCEHFFCKECLDRLFITQLKCPLCREDITNYKYNDIITEIRVINSVNNIIRNRNANNVFFIIVIVYLFYLYITTLSDNISYQHDMYSCIIKLERVNQQLQLCNITK